MEVYFIVTVICLFWSSKTECRESVRGISPTMQPFYRPAKDFRCLDGSQIIPYDRVNDDYCDCGDSTDEPGTAACPNGSFYCTNIGYKHKIIPSSRVNDGICDCCDGSDEYTRRTVCENSCLELGKQMRVEELKMHQLLVEGHKIFGEYCQAGQMAIAEKQIHLGDLEKEKVELEGKRQELERIKNEAEAPEKEAKELHNKLWEAEKDKRKEERKKQSAIDAFKQLDADQNNLVSVQEIQSHSEFDIDSNGEVSIDEAKEYLEEHEQIGFDDFYTKVWDNINQIYRKPGSEKAESSEAKAEAPTPTESPSPGDEDEERYYGDEGEEGDEDDEDKDEEEDDNRVKEEKKKEGETEEEDIPMPDYNEETKQLIAAADAARNEYNDIDKKYQSVETDMGNIKKLLEFDLGPNKEFYQIKGQCFDYTDREYIYTLCPFEKASQRNKHGGSETSLGNWGSWTGPSDSKYSVMKYDRGQNCWNGPDRSATVHLQCGISNELISVTEPNRCEYRFVFNTPSSCSQQPEPPQEHIVHEDL